MMKKVVVILLAMLMGVALGQTSNVVSGPANPVVGASCGAARVAFSRSSGQPFYCVDDDLDGVTTWTTRANFNVKAYGAKGDGTTDDTTAIQAAITAAAANNGTVSWSGGGGVYFPAGRYVVSAPLTIPRTDRPSLILDAGPLVLRGDGFASSLLLAAATFPDNRAVIEWESSEKMSLWNGIHDLAIRIPYMAGKSGIWAVHFDLVGAPATLTDLYKQRFMLETRNVVVYGDNRTAAGGFKLEGNVYMGRFVNTGLDLEIDSTANMTRDSILFKFDDGTINEAWSDQNGCSTCYFEDIHVGRDRGLGGQLITGSLYQSTIMRAVAIAPNYVAGAAYLDLKKSFNTRLINMQFEGYPTGATPPTSPMILVTDSWNVDFENLALGCPPNVNGKDGVSFVNTSASSVRFAAHETGWCGWQYYGSKKKMLLDVNSRHNTIWIPSAGPIASEISDLGTDNNWVGFDYNLEAWAAGGTRYTPSLTFPTAGQSVLFTDGFLRDNGHLTIVCDSDNSSSTATDYCDIDPDGSGDVGLLRIASTAVYGTRDGDQTFGSNGNLYLMADRDGDDTATQQIILGAGGNNRWLFDRVAGPERQRLLVYGTQGSITTYWRDLASGARTIYFPDTGGDLCVSSLANNGIDLVNSVWLASNGIIAEGSSADANETTVSFTNPTADRTFTVPNASGTATLFSGSAANGGHVLWGTGTTTCTTICTNAGGAACDFAYHLNTGTGARTSSTCSDATNETKECFCR